MLPTRIFESKIASFPIEIQEIALELRNLVAEVAPGATEQTHPRGFSYFFKEKGGPVSAGICQISLFNDHVNLGFIHGAFINDPKKLLTGKTKAKRYLVINWYSDANWDYYKQLIHDHSVFDPSDEETQIMMQNITAG
ncbi:DUF1801 domain-containing protein [Chloroflexota bacterium]